MRFKQVYENEWQKPVMRGYKMKCCKCGIVHVVDFEVFHWGKGHKILLKAKHLKK